MRFAIIGLMILSCSGCATIMTGGGPTQSVRFTSEPRGAMVNVDGNYIGLTPIAADLTRKDDHFATVSFGGDSRETEIKHGANLWIFGNILFGGLVGIIVDTCSGSMDGALSPGDVHCKFTSPAPPPAY